MSAIHLARGATERDLIVKIEGSYDGHHDAVMVSCYPELDELGPRESPNPVPFGAGYPQAVVELTRPGAVQRCRGAGERAEEARGQGRRPDHGAGDDEHQHHPAEGGLPRAGPRALHRARCAS